MTQNSSHVDRRKFLGSSWPWVKLAAAVALLYPVFGFLGFKVPRKPEKIKVYKTLKKGRFVLEREFILFAGDSGKPWAVSRTCTHLGCHLNYGEKEDLLICPCHHSMFTTRGKLVSGPARNDLPLYQVAELPAGEGRGYVVTI